MDLISRKLIVGRIFFSFILIFFYVVSINNNTFKVYVILLVSINPMTTYMKAMTKHPMTFIYVFPIKIFSKTE